MGPQLLRFPFSHLKWKTRILLLLNSHVTVRTQRDQAVKLVHKLLSYSKNKEET